MPKTAVLFCTAILVAVLSGPVSAAASETHDVRLLHEAFMKDPEAFRARYVGKRIVVEGIVTESGPSIYATPKVELSDVENGRSYAACILPRKDFPKLTEFKKGMRVRFSGSCRGGTTSGEMVLLKECAVAE